MGLHTFRATALALAAAGALAACSSGSPSAAPVPSPSRTHAGAGCPTYEGGSTPVYFGPDGGTELAGLLYGTGTIGIVFGHESGDDACDWTQEAQMLAKQGYRTLAFDFNGDGASQPLSQNFAADMNSAAEYLAKQGATSVVYIGSSMGGTAAIEGASEEKTVPVAAVVALSAPQEYAGCDAIDAVGGITAPMLFAAGDLDGTFASDARALYKGATSAKYRKLVVVGSSWHGHLLLARNEVAGNVVINALAAFLAKYAPPQ